MFNEKRVVTRHDFHGISVLVPRQGEGKLDLLVKEKGSKLPRHLKLETEEFNVIRVVANIALYRQPEGKRQLVLVKEFNPPIELRVAYDMYDVMRCGGNHEELRLAYWDGRKWVHFTEEENDFLVLPPGTAPVAEVRIRSWAGDPPIAWGHP